MPTFDIYDSFGAGFNVTEAGPFIPVDPSIQIGALTYSGSLATGSVTGSPHFDLVRITYATVNGATEFQVTRVEFGTQPTGQEFDPALILGDLTIPVSKATLDAGSIDWLRVDTTGNDEFFGNNLVDLIEAGTGNDSISGFGGEDTLYGEAGDDLLVGDLGDDTLDGGEGDDAAFFFGRPSEYSFYVRLDGAVEVTDNVEGGTDVVLNVETFEFQFGGSFTQQDLFNPVKVYAGNDTITGTNGNNVLKGYGGNDTMKALGGNDYLHGGLGRDKLYGGLGRDQFVFDTRPNSTNKDTIYDFKVKDDTIRLENSIFTKIGSKGYLKPGAFWTNNTGRAHDKDDRIIYDKDSGVLYYDADGTGSSKAMAFTTITKNLSMTSKDIYIV